MPEKTKKRANPNQWIRESEGNDRDALAGRKACCLRLKKDDSLTSGKEKGQWKGELKASPELEKIRNLQKMACGGG